MLHIGGDVQRDPEQQKNRLDDDKRPRAHGRGNRVGNSLPKGELASRGPRAIAGPAQPTAQCSQFSEQLLLGFVQFNLYVFHSSGPSLVSGAPALQATAARVCIESSLRSNLRLPRFFFCFCRVGVAACRDDHLEQCAQDFLDPLAGRG